MVDVSDGPGTAAGAIATGTDAGNGSAAAEDNAVDGGSGAPDTTDGGSAEASGHAASVSSMTGTFSSTRLLLTLLAVASSDALALLGATGALFPGVMATGGRLLRHKLQGVMKALFAKPAAQTVTDQGIQDMPWKK